MCVGTVLVLCVVAIVVCFLYCEYIECLTKKNDVGLQITPCCSTVVQVCAPNVPPVCEQTNLISAVSALLSDDTESLD